MCCCVLPSICRGEGGAGKGCRRVAIGDGRGAAESRPAVPAVSLLKRLAGERAQGCTRGAGRCRWSPAQGCGRREMLDGAELSFPVPQELPPRCSSGTEAASPRGGSQRAGLVFA